MEGNEEFKVINIESAKNSLSKKLTDSDINSLFLGLIRLVKKTAQENVNKELKDDYINATNNFRQTLIDLNKIEIKLKREQQKNVELEILVESQKEQICYLLNCITQLKNNDLTLKEKTTDKLKNYKINKEQIKKLENNCFENKGTKSKKSCKKENRAIKTCNLSFKCYNMTIAEFKVKQDSLRNLLSLKQSKDMKTIKEKKKDYKN